MPEIPENSLRHLKNHIDGILVVLWIHMSHVINKYERNFWPNTSIPFSLFLFLCLSVSLSVDNLLPLRKFVAAACSYYYRCLCHWYFGILLVCFRLWFDSVASTSTLAFCTLHLLELEGFRAISLVIWIHQFRHYSIWFGLCGRYQLCPSLTTTQ